MMDEAVYGALSAIDIELARYAGLPAVFYQQAPPVTDPQWAGAKYPRITFAFKYVGKGAELTVKTWCGIGGGVTPEQMERAVREALHYGLELNESGERCIIIRRSSEPFEDAANPPNLHVAGYIMKFELRELTCNRASYRLPVEAINSWTARKFPLACVIGHSEDGREFRPYGGGGPIVYWHVAQVARDKLAYGCVWLNVELRLSIFGDVGAMYLSVMEMLLRDGFIWMGDDSPIHFDSAKICGDELIVIARYGIFPEDERGLILSAAHKEYRKGA